MRRMEDTGIADAVLGTLTPIGASSLSGLAYDRIRALVLSGEVPAGARLSQEGLADRLAISRTPVREALRRLAGEGLLQALPQRGFRVAELGAAAVRSRMEVRLILEPGIARLAAERANEHDIVALHLCISEQRHAEDSDRAHDASRAFHVAVARATHNDEFASALDANWLTEVGRRLTRERAAPGWASADAREHEAIAEAIEAADANAAEALMREHVLAALHSLTSPPDHGGTP